MGACIDEDTAGRWEDYIAAHPLAKPFRNKGWTHLDAFDTLCGDALVTGAHVFHPSQSISMVPALAEPEEVVDMTGNEGDVDEMDEKSDGEGELAIKPSSSVCVRNLSS